MTRCMTQKMAPFGEFGADGASYVLMASDSRT
jgi:hypothetical protein